MATPADRVRSMQAISIRNGGPGLGQTAVDRMQQEMEEGIVSFDLVKTKGGRKVYTTRDYVMACRKPESYIDNNILTMLASVGYSVEPRLFNVLVNSPKEGEDSFMPSNEAYRLSRTREFFDLPLGEMDAGKDYVFYLPMKMSTGRYQYDSFMTFMADKSWRACVQFAAKAPITFEECLRCHHEATEVEYPGFTAKWASINLDPELVWAFTKNRKKACRLLARVFDLAQVQSTGQTQFIDWWDSSACGAAFQAVLSGDILAREHTGMNTKKGKTKIHEAVADKARSLSGSLQSLPFLWTKKAGKHCVTTLQYGGRETTFIPGLIGFVKVPKDGMVAIEEGEEKLSIWAENPDGSKSKEFSAHGLLYIEKLKDGVKEWKDMTVKQAVRVLHEAAAAYIKAFTLLYPRLNAMLDNVREAAEIVQKRDGFISFTTWTGTQTPTRLVNVGDGEKLKVFQGNDAEGKNGQRINVMVWDLEEVQPPSAVPVYAMRVLEGAVMAKCMMKHMVEYYGQPEGSAFAQIFDCMGVHLTARSTIARHWSEACQEVLGESNPLLEIIQASGIKPDFKFEHMNFCGENHNLCND